MDELAAALADTSPEAEESRVLRVARGFYVANRLQGVRQNELVRRFGVSRETVRRHVEDERIRRGEIDPTPRYLKAQERKRARQEADGS